MECIRTIETDIFNDNANTIGTVKRRGICRIRLGRGDYFMNTTVLTKIFTVQLLLQDLPNSLLLYANPT